MKTNRDIVQSLSTHKLAQLFISRHYLTGSGHSREGVFGDCDELEYYTSTLILGRWYDVFDAVAAVEKYLDAEMDRDWEYELESQRRDHERAVL